MRQHKIQKKTEKQPKLNQVFAPCDTNFGVFQTGALSEALRRMTATLAAVAAGSDVTTAIILDQESGRGARCRSPPAKPIQRQRLTKRQRSTTTGDTLDAQTQQRHPRRTQQTDRSAGHVRVVAQKSIHPPSPPTTFAAERPKSLDLRHASRAAASDTPEVTATTSGMPKAVPAMHLVADQADSIPAARGHRLKVSDNPGSEPRAEVVKRSRYDSAAAGGGNRVQTPDSGLGVSPLDQRSTSGRADLVLQDSSSGTEYRIAQTPNKSTIVIIRNDAQGRTASTPNSSTPVREDQIPVAVVPSVLPPGAATAATTSRQPVAASAAKSKFVVADATMSASGGPGFRSKTTDEGTAVRLNSGDGEQRRYIIAAGTLTTVESAAQHPPAGDSALHAVEHRTPDLAHAFSRPRNDVQLVVGSRPAAVESTTRHPPAGDSALQSPMQAAEHRTPDLAHASSRPRNDVQLVVGSRSAAVTRSSDPPRTQAPAERVTPSPRPKPSVPVKHRDAKSTAVAKFRQSAAKRLSGNGKRQSGQRSKQSQGAPKQSESRSPAPVKLSQGGGERQDSGLEQASQPAKRSVAELRAIYQSS